MLLDLKPLFAGSKEFIPVDYSMDLSEVDFYGIKPMKKPIAISGQIVSRAGIVEAGLTCSVEYTAPCDRCGEETKKTYSFKIVRTIVSELENEDTDEMTVDVYKVRWTKVSSNRFDTTAFKKAMPELAEKFTRVTESRRFSVC